jgi:hypothetical protein
MAERMVLSKSEVEDILFCEIEKFTADRLITYAERLFSPTEVEVIIKPKKGIHTPTV